jgi:small subunit ribosomal protein S3e
MFTQNISKKRKFIKQGLFFAEINEFLRRMLAEDGYAGVQIKPTPQATQVVIRCTKTNEVVAKIPYIQKLLQLRWKFDSEDNIKVFAEKVQPRGLSARAQAQSICYKLKGGLAVRRACYGVLKFIMDNGAAKGVQIIISGKLRGARAKAMKFKEGYMICSGHAKNAYITEAVEHVLLRQGTIGVRVTIMLPHDPEGKNGGVKENLPDIVTVHKPQDYEKDKEFEPFRAEEQGMAQPQAQAQPLGGQPVTAGYGAPQQEAAPQGVYQATGYGQQYQTPGGPDQRQQAYQNQGQYNPQGYSANAI